MKLARLYDRAEIVGTLTGGFTVCGAVDDDFDDDDYFDTDNALWWYDWSHVWCWTECSESVSMFRKFSLVNLRGLDNGCSGCGCHGRVCIWRRGPRWKTRRRGG